MTLLHYGSGWANCFSFSVRLMTSLFFPRFNITPDSTTFSSSLIIKILNYHQGSLLRTCKTCVRAQMCTCRNLHNVLLEVCRPLPSTSLSKSCTIYHWQAHIYSVIKLTHKICPLHYESAHVYA